MRRQTRRQTGGLNVPEYTFQFIEKNFTVEAVIPGVSAASGASASLRSTGIAVGAVSALKAVASVPGGFAVANPDDPGHSAMLAGVALTAANDSESFTLISAGELDNPAWNWLPSLPVYLGRNGALTQTCPQDTRFVQQIGIPIGNAKLMIRPGQPILSI